MGKVLVERKNGVVWATINRAAKRNAVDFDVMEQFKVIIADVASNKDDQMLVITGAGDQAFCSGGDLSVFHNLHTKDEAYSMLSKMGEVLYDLLTLPKPTVALLNGAAIGGGCEIASACDFRLARKGAKFGFVQGKLAITTGWGGATMLLEKMTYDKAMTLLKTANRFSVQEGLELGFIHQLLDDEDYKQQCEQWLAAFIEQKPSVLEAYKKVAIRKWERSNIRERIFEEIELCSILWEADEHHDAVKSFIEKN